MKTLKIVSFISFLLISGLQEVGLPIFISIVYIIVNLIINSNNSNLDFWLGGLLGISIIGTLIIYLICRKGKDRLLSLFCFIALLLAALFLTGATDPTNYKRISLGFFIPLLIFIISSVWITILNFMKPITIKEENLKSDKNSSFKRMFKN